MKILKADLRKGEVSLKPENENDWVAIHRILRKGDVLKGQTVRSVEIIKGDRKEKVRKKLYVEIEIEKIEMTDAGIRANGRVLNESEFLKKGSYHSFEITFHPFTIQRDWSKSEIDYLRRFEKKLDPVMVVLIDDTECQVYEVSESEKMLAEFRWPSGKSLGEQPKSYKDLVEFLKNRYNGRLIIAGPGFAKEKLAKSLPEGWRFLVDSTSHTGLSGLREVLKRGLLERLSKNIRIGKESVLVEEFFSRIAKGGMVDYGRENVLRRLEMGAVETLLVSDRHIADEMIQKAEKYGTAVEIISSSHESGKRFLEFGGYGALLRFK